MAIPPLVAALLLFLLWPEISEAQQSYVNNKQLNCTNMDTRTFGFVCNGVARSCPSFLTFRSTPTYNRPDTIAHLLEANASQIAAANNISDIQTIPDNTLVLVPINCSCSRNYYQHDASYTIKGQGETYFTMANNTYQALTTCQAMEAQNPYDFRQLVPDMDLNVPLRCACPTRNQTASGFKYLLTYLVPEGDSFYSIATTFGAGGADIDSIAAANNLSRSDIIYFFTPILVPLKIEPKQNIDVPASTPPQPSPPPAPPTPPSSGGSDSNKGLFIGVGVGAAVLITLASILAIWFFRNRRRKQKPPTPPPKLAEKSGNTTKQFSSWSVSSVGIRSAIETLTVYKFDDIEKATESFAESNRITDGSSVYRASFKGDDAVVKIMKGDVSREIDALRQINHSRIVRLSGFCVRQGLTYLVYEYAENGPLTDWLRPGLELQNKHSPRLDWKQRLQVAYDVADALNYLHNFTNPPYIHKNLTSSNVLLDTMMRAKITNFGLAKVLDTDDQVTMTRHVVGTYGYMSPEYVESGLITPKLDVYALGVVILELLSGRKAVSGDTEGEQVVLAQTIQEVLGAENLREKLREFIDPRLEEDYPQELAYYAAQLAKSCVAHDLDSRPAMAEVFLALSKLLLSSLEWDPSQDTSQSFSN